MNTRYNEITEDDIRAFRNILDTDRIISDSERLLEYSHDETEDLQFLPSLVVLPVNTAEVTEIIKYCAEKNFPVTARAAGTGLSGGALPIHGGVILSVERMNKILKIDEKNHQVITQPGVITQELQEAVEAHDLFYPVDPASKGSCFIGGNIAENSGGPRAVKYGVVKDYVLNLEIVLPSGKCIWTGANVLKNATGYNLTQLIVGSEGTLGIVTKIVLKLLPKPTRNILMLAPFDNAEEACQTVAEIFHLGITPSALEFMERDALDLSMKYNKVSGSVPVGKNVRAHLIIEVDGNEEHDLEAEAEKIFNLLDSKGCKDILYADSEAQKETIWKLRRAVSEAVKRESVYKEEDTCVPRYELPRVLKKVKDLGKEYGFRSVCYGHAGDGNLHINILKDDMDDEKWNATLTEAITELFKTVNSLNGILSGEHGIGYVQKEYMPLFFDESHLDLQLKIKELFDPKNILNPGKIFPSNDR